jgi:hypothetical protein
MVSLAGGAIGVVLGLAVGVALLFWDVPVLFSIRAMGLAFGCAVGTGLIFGYLPARQAARHGPRGHAAKRKHGRDATTDGGRGDAAATQRRNGGRGDADAAP